VESQQIVTERGEWLLIPLVYSSRGIRAYDELQKSLQPKSGKSDRRLQSSTEKRASTW